MAKEKKYDRDLMDIIDNANVRDIISLIGRANKEYDEGHRKRHASYQHPKTGKATKLYQSDVHDDFMLNDRLDAILSGGRMKFQEGGFIPENEYAHSNIDKIMNQIDPSTIKETRRGLSPLGLNINALYEGFTRGDQDNPPEKREIFQTGHPSEEEQRGEIDKFSQQLMLTNLLKQIEMNPDFADTLTAETRPDIKAELDYSGKPLRYLKHMFFGK
jgi:hypothetical protein